MVRTFGLAGADGAVNFSRRAEGKRGRLKGLLPPHGLPDPNDPNDWGSRNNRCPSRSMMTEERGATSRQRTRMKSTPDTAAKGARRPKQALASGTIAAR